MSVVAAGGPPAGAQSHPRQVSVSATEGLVDGQRVTVRWEGFRPGPVVIAQCDPRALQWGARGFCLWDAQVVADTGPDGRGQASFEVAAGALSPYAMLAPPDISQWSAAPLNHQFSDAVRGPGRTQTLPFLEGSFGDGTDVGFPLVCDDDQPCDLVVTESALRLDPARSAKATLGFDRSTAADKPSRIGPQCPPGDPADWESWDPATEQWPGQAASDWPGKVVHRPAADPTATWPERSADPPPAAPDATIEVRGGNGIGPALDRWGRRLTAGPERLGVERHQADSSFRGMEALITALALGREGVPPVVASSIPADRAHAAVVRDQHALVEERSGAVEAVRSAPGLGEEERARALAEAQAALDQASADLAALEAFDPAEVVHAPVAVTTVGIGYQLRYNAQRYTAFPPQGMSYATDCPYADSIPEGFVTHPDWENTFDHDYLQQHPAENVGVDAPFLKAPARWVLSAYASFGESVPGVEAATWSSSDVEAENGALAGDRVGLVYRKEPSGQGDLVARWLHAQVGAEAWRDAWSPYRAEVPAPDAAAFTEPAGARLDLLAVKGADSAPQAADLLADSGQWEPPNKDDPFAVWIYGTRNKAIGFVDAALAAKKGVPLAHIPNPAGRWVQPSRRGALAAVAAGEVRDDGSFEPDLAAADPDVYPLTQVYHLAFAPAALDAAQRDDVADLVAFATSEEGQRVAEEEGYIALPPSLDGAVSQALKALSAPASAPAGGGPDVLADGGGPGGDTTGGAGVSTPGGAGGQVPPGGAGRQFPGGRGPGDAATAAGPGADARAGGEPVEMASDERRGDIGGGIVPRMMALAPPPLLAALGIGGALATRAGRRALRRRGGVPGGATGQAA